MYRSSKRLIDTNGRVQIDRALYGLTGAYRGILELSTGYPQSYPQSVYNQLVT